MTVCRGSAIPIPSLGLTNHRSRNEMGLKIYENSGSASLVWSFLSKLVIYGEKQTLY